MDRYGLFLTPEELKVIKGWYSAYTGEVTPDKKDELVEKKIRQFISIDEYLKNNKVK